MNLKTRILVAMILAVCSPVLVTSIVVSQRSSDIILSGNEQSLSAVAQNKAIESYFNTIKNQLASFSEDKMIVDATIAFRREFSSFLKNNQIDSTTLSKYRKDLSQYYFGDFSEEYSAKNFGQTINPEKLLSKLDDYAIAMQYHFIANNKHPLGEKDALDSLNGFDKGQYSQIHEEIHPIVRRYLKRFGFYDIFIVDASTGHIIYSVFKELDFATSLKTGPYSDSAIGRAFKRGLTAAPQKPSQSYPISNLAQIYR